MYCFFFLRQKRKALRALLTCTSLLGFLNSFNLPSYCSKLLNFWTWIWLELESVLASKLESDLWDTVDWGKKWLVDFNAGKTQLVSFDWSNNTGAMWKWMGLFLRKSNLLRCWGWPSTFSSKLDWSSYIISITKTASKKTAVLIGSMKFLFPEVALYHYKSAIFPRIEYCCHVWIGAPSCYLELLEKLQKWICRSVDPSLVASLESLAHLRNLASLNLFYSYNFGSCSSELAQLVPLYFICGRSTRYSNSMIFLSPFLDVTRMSMLTVSFLAQLDSGILCLQKAFLWPMILLALSLELTDIF